MNRRYWLLCICFEAAEHENSMDSEIVIERYESFNNLKCLINSNQLFIIKV